MNRFRVGVIEPGAPQWLQLMHVMEADLLHITLAPPYFYTVLCQMTKYIFKKTSWDSYKSLSFYRQHETNREKKIGANGAAEGFTL